MTTTEKTQEEPGAQSPKPTRTVIFAVYGTLKKGFGNNALLRNEEFLGSFKTPAEYTLYEGGFPIVERNGKTAIQCELYRTSNEAVIRNVFGLEGCRSQTKGHADNWYDIDFIETPYGEATMFVMDSAGRKTTEPSGNWRNTRIYENTSI